MNIMKLRAMAKINLGLDVIRKRDDGYHDVKMVMQTISLHDRIELKKIEKPDIIIKTNLAFLPTNENNLVYKAAELLRKEFHIKNGLFIKLTKYIPVAAGMAGGSSDCASVLFGVNKMFNLGLSKTDLMERAVKLGADVPYCILRGTALSEGIGEIITPLPPMPNCHILIAKPNINVSTKWVYESLNTSKLAHHPDIDGLIEGIKKQDLYSIIPKMENVLEVVTIQKYPVIDQIKQQMLNTGALHSMMSGSGPTVFGLFDDFHKLQHAYTELSKSTVIRNIYITNMYNPNPYHKNFDKK